MNESQRRMKTLLALFYVIHIFLVLLSMNMTLGLTVHGIFQNESLAADVNETWKNFSINGESIHIQKNSNLFDLIRIAGWMQHRLHQHGADNNHIFTDLNKLQSAILRQTIPPNNFNASKKEIKESTHFNAKMSAYDEAKHRYLIDEMMSFLDSHFTRAKSITVITDETQVGSMSLGRILEKCSETKRTISAFKVISETTSDEEIKNFLQGDIFVVACEGNLAVKLLKIAKRVGYTGHIDGVNWIFSYRTTATLRLSCSLPEGLYFGVQVEQEDFDANYMIKSVNKCTNSSLNKLDSNECRRTQLRLKKVVFVRLWTRLEETPGKAWVPVNTKCLFTTLLHGNPFWPRLKVAVANTFQPWITIVDFEKTDSSEPYCGLNGKYGYRYVNSTTNLTVPICAYGLAVDIVRYLEEKHELIGDIHVSKDGLYGGYNKSSGKVTGLVAEIVNGDADIVVDMMEEPSRRKAVEFTKPYEVAHHGIAYIKRKQELKAGVFGPFSGLLWAVIMSFIIGLVLLFWALERFSPFGRTHQNKDSPDKNDQVFGISESMEYIWGTFLCGEIIQEKPVATGSRVTSIFISFVFIMIVSVYSANLITSFVVVDETPLITGIKDPKIIVEKSGYKLGTQLATATANYIANNGDAEVRQISKRMKYYKTYKESIDALKNREIDFFFSDYLSLKTTAASDTGCTFKVVQADSNFGALGISFKKGSPWKRKLNLAAVSMADSGEKDRLLKYWFGSGSCIMTNEFGALSLSHVGSLFIFASYAACACIAITLVVFAYFKARKLCIYLKQLSQSS